MMIYAPYLPRLGVCHIVWVLVVFQVEAALASVDDDDDDDDDDAASIGSSSSSSNSSESSIEEEDHLKITSLDDYLSGQASKGGV